MKDSKLIRILATFTPDEMRCLVVFSQSSIFNNGSRPLKVTSLLEYLNKVYPDFKETDVDENKIYSVIFEDTTFRFSKVDKLFSETIFLVRKFINFGLREITPDVNFWLNQAIFFKSRCSASELKYCIEQAQKSQKNILVKEEEFLINQFKIEEVRLQLFVETNDMKGASNLSDAIQALDSYYIAKKMEYATYLLTKGNSTVVEAKIQFILLDEVVNVAGQRYLEQPLIAVYYFAYKLLLNYYEFNNPYYLQLKLLLSQKGAELSLGNMKAMHSYLRNYVADKYNRGDTKSLGELFSLFRNHALQGTLYQDSGTILASTLQSAITVALKLGETDWALNFLEENRHRIVGADDPEAIYEFNLANCHFHKGEYAVVEHCLANYNYKEMFYKLAARRMEIKLYYETNSPLLDARLAAFKIFVHEQKSILPPDKIAPNNHFADLMRQIIAPKTLGNPTRVKKLMDKLVEQKAVAEREWLQQKLVELL